MQRVFSTKRIPEAERVRYWEDLVSQLFTRFEVKIDPVTVDEFVGTLVRQSTENFEIFELSTNAPHKAYHPGTPYAEARDASLVIVLQVEGEGSIRQDGRRDVIKCGDLTLFDASREFELRFDGPVRLIAISMPWQTVQKQLISPRRVTGMGISGRTGAGGVASGFVTAFAQQASSLEASERDSLKRSMIDILNVAIISRLDQSSLSKSDYVALQQNMAEMYMEENLRDPDLTPATIASAIGVSQRYLSKLFASEDRTPHQMIWERRLENCRRDLENASMDGKSITEIAHSWGFKSSSHFSRYFKKLFGERPRDIRSARG